MLNIYIYVLYIGLSSYKIIIGTASRERGEKPTDSCIKNPCPASNIIYVLAYITLSWWCMILADLPVGRQDLLVLLKKLIRYIQIKVH